MITPCTCGATFRTHRGEAQHRHNFPAMCRKPRIDKRHLRTKGLRMVDLFKDETSDTPAALTSEQARDLING